MLLLSLVRATCLTVIVLLTASLLGFYNLTGLPGGAVTFFATVLAFFVDQVIPTWLIEKFEDSEV